MQNDCIVCRQLLKPGLADVPDDVNAVNTLANIDIHVDLHPRKYTSTVHQSLPQDHFVPRNFWMSLPHVPRYL